MKRSRDDAFASHEAKGGTMNESLDNPGIGAAIGEFAAAIAQGRPASPGSAPVYAAHRILDAFYRHTGVLSGCSRCL